MLAQNPDWRPSRRAYAGPRRIFTDAQEDQLINQIVTIYLAKGLFYCDEDFKLDARRFYQELGSELEAQAVFSKAAEEKLRMMPEFKASAHFVQDFRARHRMALRRPSLKRRRRITEEEMTEFVHQVEEVMERVPADRIINLDEAN
jgi:hypothetical protein